MVYSEKHKHSLCQHRKMRFLQPPVIPVSIFSTLGPPISKHSWGYVQDHPSKHSWGYVQSHPFLQQLLSEGAPSTVHKAQLLVFCFCFVFFSLSLTICGMPSPPPWQGGYKSFVRLTKGKGAFFGRNAASNLLQ